jgi:5-methylcytosine-specific restriction endonuclease McrA
MKNRYKGLKFNYKIGDHVLMDKYLTIEGFLNKKVKTIAELKSILANGYDILNENILLKNKNRKKQLERKSIHSIEEIRGLTKSVLFERDCDAKIELDGDIIKGNSQRYQTFFTKGTKCVCCGIEGRYFAKEKCVNAKSYHLNLYAIDENGEEVLMTKDHIIPRSKGGKNNISNYQTMCERCNVAKGNRLEQ